MPSIRRLLADDLEVLVAFLGVSELRRETLSDELENPEVYLWMGLFEDSGDLAGVHRGMRLGDYLLLKGVLVASRQQGSTAALNLALAISERAKVEKWDGVAAWIEPSKPERHLAGRLRIAAQGPLVHRYQIPIGLPNTEALEHQRGRCGALALDLTGAPLVPDLISLRPQQFWWVLDDRRLVLSGNPCPSANAIPALLRAIRPLAMALGASTIETHVPAADILSAVAILSPGVKRLSRTPVRMGLRCFRQTHSTTGHAAAVH